MICPSNESSLVSTASDSHINCAKTRGGEIRVSNRVVCWKTKKNVNFDFFFFHHQISSLCCLIALAHISFWVDSLPFVSQTTVVKVTHKSSWEKAHRKEKKMGNNKSIDIGSSDEELLFRWNCRRNSTRHSNFLRKLFTLCRREMRWNGLKKTIFLCFEKD